MMAQAKRQEVLEKLNEFCPEIEQLGLYTIVLSKGRHY